MRSVLAWLLVLSAGCGTESSSSATPPDAGASGSAGGSASSASGHAGSAGVHAGGGGGTDATSSGGSGAAAGSNAGAAGTPSGAAGAGGGGAGAAGSGGTAGTGASAGAAGAGAATTLIRVHYPVASGHALVLRGDSGALSWMSGAAMKVDADDTWTYSTTAIDKLAQIKPLLDDATWSRGPNFHVSPGSTIDLYPHFTTTAGKVTLYAASFHSQKLPSDRPVWAYLPPTYLENAKAFFPVVYMHDGQNLFGQPGAFGDWKVDQAMDAGAEDASIREAIIIGIGNTPARIYEYTPTFDASTNDGGGADAYLALLATELKPKIDADLRTLPGRETTALLGSSLGGLVSAYGGLQQASTWGLVGVMSPSTWWDDQVIIADVKASAGAPLRSLRVYVDSGDSGPSNDDVAQTKALAFAYQGVGHSLGKDLAYVVQAGGQHNETYWAARVPGALAFLLGPRPDLRGMLPAGMDLVAGAVLNGKYRVERVIGCGAMGVVLSAEHVVLRQKIALKVLLPAAAGDVRFVQRFRREAELMAKLRGEHAVHVHDVGVLDDGRPFIAMEYLEGRDLRAVMGEEGLLPIERAVLWIVQACEGVAEAHARGIVHRDLKPTNLFLTARGDGSPLVKVLDFGVSKPPPALEEDASQILTGTSAVLGSPRYMSPEQLRAPHEVDVRTDVWALAAILHEMLTGAPPFSGSTTAALCASIVGDPPARLRVSRPDASVALEEALLAALEKDADARTPTVAALAGALVAAIDGDAHARAAVTRIARVLEPSGGESELLLRTGPITAPRRRRAFALFALGAAASIGGGVLVLLPPRHGATEAPPPSASAPALPPTAASAPALPSPASPLRSEPPEATAPEASASGGVAEPAPIGSGARLHPPGIVPPRPPARADVSTAPPPARRPSPLEDRH